ncbi:MAG: hypothetical protein H0W88_00330 [Parachlamydiaceae bacterium]|nr:hypothetical protein [Parachlamydiaceae bacterium]
MNNYIEFDANSFSNKNISFINGEKDTIKYSYCGRFNKLGEEYDVITLEKYYEIARNLNVIQMFDFANQGIWMEMEGRKPTKEDRIGQVAMHLKKLYVARNCYAMSHLIKQKKALIEKTTEDSINFIKKSRLNRIIQIIVKIVTFGRFDYIQSLINKVKPDSLPVPPEYIEKALLEKSIPSIHSYSFAKQIKLLGEILTGQKKLVDAAILKCKISGQILDLDQANIIAENMITNPNGKFEDYFEFSGKLAEEFSINQIYQLNLENCFGHSNYLNGHLHDSR